jgi:hypothetical protein
VNDHDRTLDSGHLPDPDLGPAGPAGHTQAARPDGLPGQIDIDHLASLVRDRIGERPDAHGDMPSVAEAVALREQAPELYDLWLKIAQERADTGNYVQRAPYQIPERLAQSGRPRALSALVVVLAFCGYLAWLGGPGPYIAGLIAVLDLIAMLGLFFGLRPEHLSGSRHPRRKRLPRPPVSCQPGCAGGRAIVVAHNRQVTGQARRRSAHRGIRRGRHRPAR